MRKRSGIVIITGVLIVLISMFIGCSTELEDSQFGTLVLTAGRMQSRTIQPQEDLIDVVAYRVSGVGPESTTWRPRVWEAPATITMSGLKAGSWSVTVEGLNSDNTVIATDTLDVIILPSSL